MREKILGLLGLMRRANAIAIGTDQGSDAIRAGRGKLLLLAADASDNVRRKGESLCEGRNIEWVPLAFGREELAQALGVSGCSMAVVTDLGFAQALSELLAANDPERYGDMAERVRLRKEKVAKRKAQKGKKDRRNKED